jgi:transposase
LNRYFLSRKIVCTQTIVHTMSKELEIPRSSALRTHRTYSAEFKAQLVAACQQPGASIAALASSQGMNANVLHRWLKEHAHSGRHQLIKPSPSDALAPISPTPAFLPVKLTVTAPERTSAEIKAEVRKGALAMSITWPISSAAEFANWATALFK